MEEIDGVAPVPLPSAMSVKERAKHLNKMESDSNLHNVKMRRHERGQVSKALLNLIFYSVCFAP